MARELKMTQGHPGRLLMTFALPLMFGNIFQQLYMVVDTAIVGKGVGMNALAALGTVDWLNWTFIGIAQGFTQGFSVDVAQKYGSGDLEGVKASVGHSLKLCLWIAIALIGLTQLGLSTFLSWLRVPAGLLADAALYSRMLAAGIPFMLFYNFCSSTLRAIGDSKTPLYAMVIASVLNIALDCLAVFGLGWGVAGAAGATIFSQGVAGGICALKIWNTPVLRIEKHHLWFVFTEGKKLMYLGTPIAVQNVIISLGGMVVQSVVNGFDTGFIAGFTASGKLYGVLEIAALSYGYAVTTYTGQNYGAGDWQRIKSGTRWAVVISLVTSAVIGITMIVFGRQITMLFLSTEDAQLARQAGDVAYLYLFIMSAGLPILYLLYAYRSALQGMGNTKIPLLSGVLEFLARVGMALLISWMGGRNEILYIEPVAWMAATVLLCISYYVDAARLGKTSRA